MLRFPILGTSIGLFSSMGRSSWRSRKNDVAYSSLGRSSFGVFTGYVLSGVVSTNWEVSEMDIYLVAMEFLFITNHYGSLPHSIHTCTHL